MAKTLAVKKPITEAQYNQALKRYADNENKAERIINKSADKIKKENERCKAELGNIPTEMETDAATIQQYCTENREKLFGDNATITTTYGTLTFHKGGHGVRYPEDADEKEINKQLIAAFKKGKLPLYVVTTEALDKKKIITDREDPKVKKVLGKYDVEIKQNESFIIKFSKSK